jgi:hypothetical protein
MVPTKGKNEKRRIIANPRCFLGAAHIGVG